MVNTGHIKVVYNPIDKKWVASIDFDRELSSGAGATGCCGDTYQEAVDRLLKAGSVEEYFVILQKEAEEEASPKG